MPQRKKENIYSTLLQRINKLIIFINASTYGWKKHM